MVGVCTQERERTETKMEYEEYKTASRNNLVESLGTSMSFLYKMFRIPELIGRLWVFVEWSSLAIWLCHVGDELLQSTKLSTTNFHMPHVKF